MHRLSDPGIGIVTALPIESAAMRTMIDQIGDMPAQPGDPNRYVNGTIPSNVVGVPHHVVLTVMAQDNNKNAAAACIDLLRSFRSIRQIIMVGIAGGIPTPERDVRLGDVVAATEGVVDYDHVRQANGGETLRRGLQGLSMDLARSAREIQVSEHMGHRLLEEPLRQIPPAFARPPVSADRLWMERGAVQHVDRTERRDEMPTVHYAAIASADRLLRDAGYRDDLVRRYPQVAAVEMEGSGIATASDLHGAHWFVVRGIADYCDSSKNDVWHAYASLTAAAYVRALLRHTPLLRRSGVPQTVDDRMRVVGLMMEIPGLAEGQTRQLMVERLRPEIRGTIRRFPAARPDLYEILSTCLDYEGGVGELIAAITFVAGDSLSVRRVTDALEGW